MTDPSDPQDRAEATDADKLAAEYPPDEPVGVDEAEVTPVGEATSESFEERDARQELGPGDQRPVVQPYHEPEEDLLDEEAQAVAEAEVGSRDPDSDSAPPPAEEAAVHVEDEPPR